MKPSGSGLRLTKEQAKGMIRKKEKKEKDVDAKKQNTLFMKLWRMKKDIKYAEGVAACKKEKAWAQKVKNFWKQGISPDLELFISIPDLDAIWKLSNPTWQALEKAKKAKKPMALSQPAELMMKKKVKKLYSL